MSGFFIFIFIKKRTHRIKINELIQHKLYKVMQPKFIHLLTNHYPLKTINFNSNKCILTEFKHEIKETIMHFELLKDDKSKMMARIS